MYFLLYKSSKKTLLHNYVLFHCYLKLSSLCNSKGVIKQQEKRYNIDICFCVETIKENIRYRI